MPIFTESQRQKLDEFRRQHAIESARLTPDERLRRSDELRRAAAPGVQQSGTDESLEIMLKWKRRTPERR